MFVSSSGTNVTFTFSIISLEDFKVFFKACVRYFLSNFYYSPNDSPSKTMKNVFYFIFLFQALFVLEIFKVFYFRLPLFFSPVSHCFGGWSKKNLKVHDDINCLSKKLITSCLISWERNKVSHWNFAHWQRIK